MKRREFLRNAASVAGVAAGLQACATTGPAVARRAPRPNVLLIITDDQGYGDLSCHGNPHLQTPNLDRLRSESTWFDRFHVSPVCSPTRASLLTGRWNYRTGVVDTFLGRSMMHSDEVTLAEALSANGYRTGIFGKWHLGDEAPLRPQDQGFQEVLVHRDGGITQPGDAVGNHYQDPVLRHNGVYKRYRGYCTDVFADAAAAFMERCHGEGAPFFAYVATNAPHTPLEIAESYVAPFLDKGLPEPVAKVYGMVTNIDENVGRLLGKLKELRIERDTIVVFLTDNGPEFPPERYVAGMRGAKGTVYEGGIRVPCFMRWPGRLEANRGEKTLAAHIDLMPTLLEACGVAAPEGVAFDGRSLWPLLTGQAVDWPDRTLFFQWHRGDLPEPGRDCAALTQRYKLVNLQELYDLEADPAEQRDVASEHPDVAARLREDYHRWFADVESTRHFAPPRIHLSEQYGVAILTRQDWRGAASRRDESLGWWEVEAAQGPYRVTALFPPATEARKAVFRMGDVERSFTLAPDEREFTLEAELAGAGRLETWVEANGERRGAKHVIVVPASVDAQAQGLDVYLGKG